MPDRPLPALQTLSHEISPHPILVVDDDETILEYFRLTLQKEGYRVITTSSPSQAVRKLKEETIAVVISDNKMPVMSGLELLALARQLQSEATRILITGVLTLDAVIQAVNEGEIFRFIVKPCLREELLATVKNAVQRYELVCRNTLLQATTLALQEKLAELHEALRQCGEEPLEREPLHAALEQQLRRSVGIGQQMLRVFYPALESHTRRTLATCQALGEAASLSADRRRVLELAAQLHLIGLVGLPRRLIRRWEQSHKPFPPYERGLWEQYPSIGQELANAMVPGEAVGKTIRAHRERFDGQGFPDQLAGENIPWLARLLAVAVAFAEGPEDKTLALDLIHLGSGSAFDPEAVKYLRHGAERLQLPRRQKEVALGELHPGMMLAQAIYDPNGLLLVPGGQRLTEAYLSKLRHHDRLEPINQSFLVYC